MKRKINIKNVTLGLLTIVNFLAFVASVNAMIEVEVSYIPLSIMVVSLSYLSLFAVANFNNMFD